MFKWLKEHKRQIVIGGCVLSSFVLGCMVNHKQDLKKEGDKIKFKNDGACDALVFIPKAKGEYEQDIAKAVFDALRADEDCLMDIVKF